jgi:hypothetical protein
MSLYRAWFKIGRSPLTIDRTPNRNVTTSICHQRSLRRRLITSVLLNHLKKARLSLSLIASFQFLREISTLADFPERIKVRHGWAINACIFRSGYSAHSLDRKFSSISGWLAILDAELFWQSLLVDTRIWVRMLKGVIKTKFIPKWKLTKINLGIWKCIWQSSKSLSMEKRMSSDSKMH